MLEFFGGLFLIIGLIVPIIGLFCYFYDRRCDYEENKMNAAYIAPSKASYEIDITYLILSLILIILGATTDKTESLVLRCLKLLFDDGVKPRSIMIQRPFRDGGIIIFRLGVF